MPPKQNSNSNRVGSALSRADADRLVNIKHENFTVADATPCVLPSL